MTVELQLIELDTSESDNEDINCNNTPDCIDCSNTFSEDEALNSCGRCDGILCDLCADCRCESCSTNVCRKCVMDDKETNTIEGFHEMLDHLNYDHHGSYCYYCVKVVFNM
jgi:hypothetical protein